MVVKKDRLASSVRAIFGGGRLYNGVVLQRRRYGVVDFALYRPLYRGVKSMVVFFCGYPCSISYDLASSSLS